MTLRALVLDHLEYTFEKEAWQPSLAMAAEGITARQAAWKPAPERHSIWQIVRHVIHWKQGVLTALDGNPPDYDRLEKTDWPEISGDETAWRADLQMLGTVSAELKERVAGASDLDLSSPIATYKGVADQAMAIRVMRTATHDIYHAGQILYLRALQGV